MPAQSTRTSASPAGGSGIGASSRSCRRRSSNQRARMPRKYAAAIGDGLAQVILGDHSAIVTSDRVTVSPGRGSQIVWLLAVLFITDSASVSHAFMVPVAPAESLSVETRGRGDPVVLIPGLFGSAFGFRKLVPLLVDAGYRTIVIEPLGVGASGRPEKANYSLTAQAARIAAVLDTLHVSSALVLAHSIGGAPAVPLAFPPPGPPRAPFFVPGGGPPQAHTP